MYYEEKVINGVLCFRNLPNAEWTPMTAKKLTEKIQKKEKKIVLYNRMHDFLTELADNDFKVHANLMQEFCHIIAEAELLSREE